MNKQARTQIIRRENPYRLSAVTLKHEKEYLAKEIKWPERGNRFTNRVEKPKKAQQIIQYNPIIAHGGQGHGVSAASQRGKSELYYTHWDERNGSYATRSKSKKKLGLTTRTRCLHYTHNSDQNQMSDLLQSFFSKVFANNDGCQCPDGCQYAHYLRLWGQVYKMDMDNNLYQKFKDMKPLTSNGVQIEKDLQRTQPQINSFKTEKYLRMLERILKAYSLRDQKVGYIQGMNIIVSGLLYHIKSEEQTFWAFSRLMYEKDVRSLFVDDFKAVYAHLKNINELVKEWINDLYIHLTQRGINLEEICFSWVLTLMSVLINIDYMGVVYKNFAGLGWSYLYRLILAYLLYHKLHIITEDDSSNILLILSVHYGQTNTKWREVLKLVETLNIRCQRLFLLLHDR